MSKLITNGLRHLGASVDNLTLDNAGRVLMPNQPAFRVGDFTASSNTYTPAGVCIFRTVFVNIGSHYNSTNGRFTAPVTARYFFAAGLLMENNANANSAFLAVNGTTLSQCEMYSSSGFTGYKRIVGSYVLSLNSGDYVTVVMPSGDLHDAGDHNSFSGFLIG